MLFFQSNFYSFYFDAIHFFSVCSCWFIFLLIYFLQKYSVRHPICWMLFFPAAFLLSAFLHYAILLNVFLLIDFVLLDFLRVSHPPKNWFSTLLIQILRQFQQPAIRYAGYGNTGCQVFKRYKIRINVPKGNYWILRIGLMGRCQKLGIILEHRVI